MKKKALNIVKYEKNKGMYCQNTKSRVVLSDIELLVKNDKKFQVSYSNSRRDCTEYVLRSIVKSISINRMKAKELKKIIKKHCLSNRKRGT